nr:hypothetical protein [Mucilaginibacter sp. L294]
MSHLSTATEQKAILLLAKCLPNFEALAILNMTAEDAFYIRSAENLIKGIIEANGFEVMRKSGKGISVRKIKKPL